MSNITIAYLNSGDIIELYGDLFKVIEVKCIFNVFSKNEYIVKLWDMKYKRLRIIENIDQDQLITTYRIGKCFGCKTLIVISPLLVYGTTTMCGKCQCTFQCRFCTTKFISNNGQDLCFNCWKRFINDPSVINREIEHGDIVNCDLCQEYYMIDEKWSNPICCNKCNEWSDTVVTICREYDGNISTDKGYAPSGYIPLPETAAGPYPQPQFNVTIEPLIL